MTEGPVSTCLGTARDEMVVDITLTSFAWSNAATQQRTHALAICG